MRKLTILLITCFPLPAFSQNDPEFPKGFVAYISAQQGVTSSFSPAPDYYNAGAGLITMHTVVPGYLRLAGGLELAYYKKQFSLLYGPRLAWKIKTIELKRFGSIANIQLQAEHLWGDDEQKMAGLFVLAEIIQKFSIHISGHRDYALGEWWLRAGVGFNILHKKRKSPAGSDPMEGL